MNAAQSSYGTNICKASQMCPNKTQGHLAYNTPQSFTIPKTKSNADRIYLKISKTYENLEKEFLRYE